VASVNYGEFNGSPLSALKIGGVGFTQLCTVNDATGNSMFSEIWWMPAASIREDRGLQLPLP